MVLWFIHFEWRNNIANNNEESCFTAEQNNLGEKHATNNTVVKIEETIFWVLVHEWIKDNGSVKAIQHNYVQKIF